MTPDEANVLLTKAGMVDPRMRRVDPNEAADRAEAWAEILETVDLGEAIAAMRTHYAVSAETLLPVHIMDRVAPVDPWANIPDVTGQVIEESKQRALAAAGITEAELEAHQHDDAWVRSKFSNTSLERGEK